MSDPQFINEQNISESLGEKTPKIQNNRNSVVSENNDSNEEELPIAKLDSQLYWINYYNKPKVNIDILTPNGLLIRLEVLRECTLIDVKEELFEKAQKQPLFGVLQDKLAYLFSCVNILTAEQEIFEDNQKICDIKPFFQLLRLIKKEDDRSEKQLNARIGFLIGKGLHEFDALKISEVNNFRWKAREFSTEVEQRRYQNSWLENIYYNYPVRVERNEQVPKYLKSILTQSQNMILIELRFFDSKHFRTLNVSCFDQVNLIVKKAIQLFNLDNCLFTSEYALKASGQEEYLFGSHMLIQYTYIRECLSESYMPSLIVQSLDKLKQSREPTALSSPKEEFRPRAGSSFSSSSSEVNRFRATPLCVLDVPESKLLSLLLRGCIRINCAEKGRVALLVGVYHGDTLLAGRVVSSCATVRSGRITLDEHLIFDISISDLPRMARYSILLFEVVSASSSSGTSRGLGNNRKTSVITTSEVSNQPLNELNGQVNPLCWVNTTLFDYRGYLRTGGCTLPMWPRTVDSMAACLPLTTLLRRVQQPKHDCEDDELSTLLNPLGTVVANPEVDNATCVTMTFPSAMPEDQSIFYPSLQIVDARLRANPSRDSQLPASEEGTDYNGLLTTDCMGFTCPPMASDRFVQRRATEPFNFAAELTAHVDMGCAQLLESAGARPESGEFVPIEPCRSSLKVPLLTMRSNSLNNLPDSLDHSMMCISGSSFASSAGELEIVRSSGSIGRKIPILNREGGSSQSVASQNSARKASKAYVQQLREICAKDPLHELTKADRELLWYLRGFCRKQLPHSLSHLLAGVRWHCAKHVQEMLGLLLHWPLLSPELGLQLLDYAYCDLHVRAFAVRCLCQLTDEQLSLYLLQLVQALKFESYLHSELSAFLLQRALDNQHIGHYLFWLLRSEMHEPCVSIKFGLLLEAYCRGAQAHMRILTKQLETLNKFREINEMIREEANKKRESREKLKKSMKNILSQSLYKDAIKDVVNPLNPRQKLDLRQDMLTLQMLRIMDKLWKDEGLDLRMSLYNVISTDFKMGLIEVVQKANTVANIQKQKAFTSATSAFQKSSLLQWLKEQNPDEEQLLKAIDEFTKSCAGYCVATYVLGVADRHSDNIMIKSNGQLLHIDFGHILGKFKEKWKIRRERVPFVLTNDFVYVITNGNSKKIATDRFEQFLDYCEKAFLILRRKGTFIIALFAMMLSTGLEMSSVKDLDYLRETLVLNLNEADALKHFRSKLQESLKNSWKTSFNWLAHNIAKDNK